MEKTKSSSKLRRLRAKYRKNLFLAIVISLIIGLIAGFVLGRMTVPAASVPAVSTPVVNEAPAGETGTAAVQQQLTLPTEAPTAAPTATPQPTISIVPYGSTQPITAQINATGSARTSVIGAYETLNFTLRVDRYLPAEYYISEYSTTYNLQGTECAIEFELLLNDYMGAQAIDPQNILDIRLENASGVIEDGYMLHNIPIGGKGGFTITTNVPNTLYKRFLYNPAKGDMKYLVVTAYVDGVPNVYKFELAEPIRATATPEVTYMELNATSTGAEVEKLQMRLIQKGYLVDGSADGSYGPNTQNAVKAAQAAFGMEQTGIADSAFQQKLYSEE